MPKKRPYVSEAREQGAQATRARILEAAKLLFSHHGVDKVTVAQIAVRAEVATPTVYAVLKSKEGILRALMEEAMFGDRFALARQRLENVTDSVEMIARTAAIARSVYDGDSRDLGLLRGVSSFSPSLRKLEQEFETMRFEMQEARVQRLFQQKRAKKDLTPDEARHILWMYTSRDVYRMFVREAGWSSERYENWLRETLLTALVAP